MLDIAQVQSYVLSAGSTRLAFIRGASQNLRIVNEEIWPKLVIRHGGKEEDIFLQGGGNLMAALPPERASDFIRDARRALERQTNMVRVVAASTPYTHEENFKGTRQLLLEKLALAKGQPVDACWPEGGSYWEQCGLCGASPVVEETGPPHNLAVCSNCRLRIRDEYREAQGSKLPKDFEEIGAQAKPLGYLALVYLDFDRMGEYFDLAAETAPMFQQQSKHFQEAVNHALQVAQEQVETGSAVTSEVLLSGGDDIAIVMPADRWIPFLERFEAKFKELHGANAPSPRSLKTPTFSAGVVIGHTHFPIAEYFRLAKILQRSAKTLRDTSAVDFEFVTSGMAGDPVSRRTPRAEQGDANWRTGKPYELQRLFDFTSAVKELKVDGPATRVNALYRMTFAGPVQAELDYCYLLARMKKAERLKLISVMNGSSQNRDSREDHRSIGARFWQPKSDGTRFTYGADLAEIWSLM
ncbi:MAG: hypothetical protein K2X03_01480 [Bryobacteraceae bacterium]|nr:hypothetical protein [Bryobacteraceae bacterium]